MSIRRVLLSCALGSALTTSASVCAFSGSAAPARFELQAKPGQVLRSVLEIGNDDTQPDEYAVQTADWSLGSGGGVAFHVDQLQPGSCRPWVRIERHRIALAPKSTRRYRFEVHVPADAPTGECRFALMIQSTREALPQIRTGNAAFPVQGRLGVIVYVAVGEGRPDLRIEGMRLDTLNNRLTPTIAARNLGTVHARMEGVLDGVDVHGKRVEFIVSTLPILAGELRSIPIWAADDASGKASAWTAPLRLRGTIEWPGGKFAVDQTLQ